MEALEALNTCKQPYPQKGKDDNYQQETAYECKIAVVFVRSWGKG